MKPIATIAILIAMLACMWSAQAQLLTQTQQNASSSNCVELDPEQLKRIKRGMSLEEIYDVIDATPTDIVYFQGKLHKDRKGTFVWYKGEDGKFLSVVLRSNAVVSMITNY